MILPDQSQKLSVQKFKKPLGKKHQQTFKPRLPNECKTTDDNRVYAVPYI